jgi:hypothetical protein
MHVSERCPLKVLDDDNYNVLESQILDSVVVTRVQLHQTVADKLEDGRVGSRWSWWLTFFSRRILSQVAQFMVILATF